MLKVVVVEDEELVRKGIVLTVDWAGAGCAVVGEAANGEEGLEVIRRYRPDLIVTDIRMPKLDGIEMLRRLREEGNRAHVVFLTAYSDFSYAQSALKLGAAVAEGVDIDPVAVRTAGENAALNGVQDKLTVLVGDLSDKASGKYDIITANIVANAILSLAPAVPGLMAEGATFIASGIIDSRKDEVIAGLEKAGLAVVEVKEKRGWECIVCKKA